MQCTISLTVPPMKGRGYEIIMMSSAYIYWLATVSGTQIGNVQIGIENVEISNVQIGMVLFWPRPLIGAQKLIALPQTPPTCWEGPGDVCVHSLEKLASFPGSSIFPGAHVC